MRQTCTHYQGQCDRLVCDKESQRAMRQDDGRVMLPERNEDAVDAANILRTVDAIRKSNGYREDETSQWLGPWLHQIEDAALAIRNPETRKPRYERGR